MTFFLNLLITVYLSLNSICFLYLLLYSFIRAEGYWDVLIYPILYRTYDRYNLSRRKQTLFTIVFTLLFAFSLFTYYCLLLFLVAIVATVTIIDNLFNNFKNRRKNK
jgi:hypothetical protein